MKRDFDLIRRILLDIEKLPAGNRRDDIEYPGEYEKNIVYEHVKYLIDEAYLNGKVIQSFSGIDATSILGLTGKGHDFIELAKDESVWNKVRENFIKSGVSPSLDSVFELLKAEMKKKIGLS